MKTPYRSHARWTRMVRLAGVLAFASTLVILPVTADAASASATITMVNPRPDAFDYFGNSVAVVGERFVVGAPSDDVAGFVNVGSAFIYSSAGALLVTITNPAPSYNAWFANSVAGVGSSHIVIGAHRNEAGANDAGAVFVFNANGVLQATVTNPAPEANDYFGYVVAGLGTDALVVGAPFDDDGLPDVGSAYCYDLNGTLLAALANPSPDVNDYFGNSVAGVGTDKIVVGAYGDDTGADNAGIVYVFDRTGVLLVTITNPAPAVDDNFGFCVAGIGANKIVVGAHKDDAGAVNAGIAYVFDTDGNLLATLRHPRAEVNDWFGYTVAGLGSNRVVVGAPLGNTGAPDAGVAYLFDLNGALQATIRNPALAASVLFGYSVCGFGAGNFIVGAHMTDRGAQDAGVAYLFKVNTSLLTDYNGDGISDLAVYDTVLNTWNIMDVRSNVIRSAFTWGYSGVAPVPGDYDGDSIADLAVFHDATGRWHILGSSGAVLAWALNWGYLGVIAVPGDYDGDSVSDLAVFDPLTGNWYIRSLRKGVLAWGLNWGFSGVVPVPGDYDGDGISDLAVYEEATGRWFVRRLAKGAGMVILYGAVWGGPGLLPVSGDYDGDGFFDRAMYNDDNASWYVWSDRRRAVLSWALPWGYAGVVPVPGDYNGDGRYDLSAYDPVTGAWQIRSLGVEQTSVIASGVIWGNQDSDPVGAAW